MVEGVEVRRVKLSDLRMVYSIHRNAFPKPARARYYEDLMKDKSSPFLVAVDDAGEVLGFISTRTEPVLRAGYHTNSMKIAAFAAQVGKDSEVSNDEIKQRLIEEIQNVFNIGGYEVIYAEVRKSSTPSIEVLKNAGFSCKVRGKYKDGESKVVCTFSEVPFDEMKDKTIKIERMRYNHLNRVMMLHNNNLKAQKDYFYFSKFMRNSGGVFLVATDSRGRVAGYLAARRQHKNSDDDESPRTLLNFISMAVDDDYRGQGIAKRLVSQLLQEARDSDVEVIKGHVRESNVGARTLYQKMKFKEIPEGQYKDTGEIKYRLHYRIRYPPVLPIIKPYFKPVGLFSLGFIFGRQTR